MRLDTQVVIGTALLLLAETGQASHGHGVNRLDRLQRRHTHHRHRAASASPAEDDNNTQLTTAIHHGHEHQEVKRGQCTFPTDAGLVAVTPGSQNAGWAMSPNQPCLPGGWCPYACPPGQVSMQWNPAVTSYVYPGSQDGGLYCNSDGSMSKPIPSNPYCKDGTGNVQVVNNMGAVHAVCQTVLPGNEAMLIPTEVDAGSSVTIAVPGIDYWASTAAHYYHNNPGVTVTEGCVWSDGTEAVGNWAPYVSGANTDANGLTFVKIAWNPIYTDDSSFNSISPSWGIKIECPDGNCNGLPCSIDPSVNPVNGVTSPDSASGAGGANFCVVTVPSGGSANIVVFNAGQSSSSSSSSGSSKAAKSSSSSTTTTTTTPSPSPTTTTTSTTTTPSTTSTTTTTPSPTTTSTTTSKTTTTTKSSTTAFVSTSSRYNTTSTSTTLSNGPHVFFQNDTATTTVASSSSTSASTPATLTNTAAAATTSSKSSAAKMAGVGRGNSAFAMVALIGVAIGYLL